VATARPQPCGQKNEQGCRLERLLHPDVSATAQAKVHAGAVKWLQYERWTIWGWIVRAMLTLLVIGTVIQLLGGLVDLFAE
jgi:hypothetical protein